MHRGRGRGWTGWAARALQRREGGTNRGLRHDDCSVAENARRSSREHIRIDGTYGTPQPNPQRDTHARTCASTRTHARTCSDWGKKRRKKRKYKKSMKFRRDHNARLVHRSLTSSLHVSLQYATAGWTAREWTCEKIKKKQKVCESRFHSTVQQALERAHVHLRGRLQRTAPAALERLDIGMVVSSFLP